ncbi:hypothetical protein BDB01DRAFT_774844 [Pilobolus umbonatus]|nr:hypothetical protein BDB01DRAFT_774844 [Pilobolus umbonatus]
MTVSNLVNSLWICYFCNTHTHTHFHYSHDFKENINMLDMHIKWPYGIESWIRGPIQVTCLSVKHIYLYMSLYSVIA